MEALQTSMTVRRLLIPVTLLASIIASSAATASSMDVARKGGLLGRWAVDCANTVKQGGPHNLIAYEATREGKLFYRRNDDPQDGNEIEDVKLGADGLIIVRVEMPAKKQTREMGITKLADGSTRAVYNHDTEGNYSVKDGIFIANGNRTPSLKRCR